VQHYSDRERKPRSLILPRKCFLLPAVPPPPLNPDGSTCANPFCFQHNCPRLVHSDLTSIADYALTPDKSSQKRSRSFALRCAGAVVHRRPRAPRTLPSIDQLSLTQSRKNAWPGEDTGRIRSRSELTAQVSPLDVRSSRHVLERPGRHRYRRKRKADIQSRSSSKLLYRSPNRL